MTTPRRLWGNIQDLVPVYIIMLTIIAWNWHLQPDMFQLPNLTTLLVELAPYILAAMAQTLVMLLGGVDLSIGAMISLASTLVATHLGGHTPSLLVLLGVLAVTTALAAVTGVFISIFRLPAIVVTLATSFLWGGLALRTLETPGGTVTTDVVNWFTGDWGPLSRPSPLSW
ncbi:MAG: hypothetical protein DLM70_10730 [Chloroflexi bacterium]|nr:MAG: hypothetical protein DLM70_10730 [Chloroflexota bacterium]